MTVPDLTVVPPPPEDDYGHQDLTPQNREAEMAVLGSMMLDKRALEEVVDLEPKDFYRPVNEMIFTVIRDLHVADKPVDVITVGDELQKRGLLNRCGGPVYLHDLVGSVATTANAGYYAEVIHETAVLRRLAQAGQRISQLAVTQGDPQEVIRQAENELEAVAVLRDRGIEKGHPWEVHDLHQIVLDGDITQETTVLQRADKFSLLYPGSFHSLAAEPESGKSWVALIGAAQELLQGNPVTYVDWEDRPGRIVSRLQLLNVPDELIVKHFKYVRPVAPIDQIGHVLLDSAAVTSTLVVLDGITEAMTLQGLDLNSQNDVAHFIHAFPKRLADLGPAVLQIDHLPKTTEDGNRFAIGAQHKLAGLDGAAYLLKVIDPFGRGKAGKARITVAKDREGYVRERAVGHHIGDLILESYGGELAARIDPPAEIHRASDGTMRYTIIMEQVSRFVEAHPDSSGNAIAKECKGGRNRILDALKVLVDEGYLIGEVSGRGGGTKYRSANAYRRANDPLERGDQDDFTPPEGL